MIIAVDGPSGSGKSTVSSELARRLGFQYVDTGAMYRALALAAARAGISPERTADIIQLAQTFPLNIDTRRSGHFGISLGEEDISRAIRHSDINKTVSLIARIPAVREVMVKKQRAFAKNGSVVMEGRDITTVVFPRADFKFFLDADPKIRAERRWKESAGLGASSLEGVVNEQNKRDELDRSREASPLRAADDAVRIDTAPLSVEETVYQMLEHINVRTERPKLFYAFSRAVLWAGFKLYSRGRITGRENIPKKGGFIIAANHRSFLDPVLIAVAAERQVSFLARDSLFQNPFFALLIRNLNAHPIRRASADRHALRLATQLLIEGHPVLMFPEGTRSGDNKFLNPKGGLGFLVARLGCPVIPTYIKGAYEAFPRGAKWIKSSPLSVTFGRPLYFSGALNAYKDDPYLNITKEVMNNIEDLSRSASEKI